MIKLRNICVVLTLFASVFFTDICVAKSVDERIYIVPIGHVENKVLEYLKNDLPNSLPINVKIEIDQQKEMPDSAYDSSRKQYDARIVLDGISRHANIITVNERILVVTGMDLYVTNSKFVFGLADSNKGVFIVSLARLKNEFYGYKPDEKLFFDRALKESIYQLGRSRGIDNCTDTKCVMHHSDSLAGIDNRTNRLCHGCKAKLISSYSSPLFKYSLKPLA